MRQVETGEFASIIVQFLDDRDGRALVRLPNGSKTRVDHGDLAALPGNGHIVGGSPVRAHCHDCEWAGSFPDRHAAHAALAAHPDHPGM
jgi:hypothetical protein